MISQRSFVLFAPSFQHVNYIWKCCIHIFNLLFQARSASIAPAIARKPILRQLWTIGHLNVIKFLLVSMDTEPMET